MTFYFHQVNQQKGVRYFGHLFVGYITVRQLSQIIQYST